MQISKGKVLSIEYDRKFKLVKPTYSMTIYYFKVSIQSKNGRIITGYFASKYRKQRKWILYDNITYERKIMKLSVNKIYNHLNHK